MPGGHSPSDANSPHVSLGERFAAGPSPEPVLPPAVAAVRSPVVLDPELESPIQESPSRLAYIEPEDLRSLRAHLDAKVQGIVREIQDPAMGELAANLQWFYREPLLQRDPMEVQARWQMIFAENPNSLAGHDSSDLSGDLQERLLRRNRLDWALREEVRRYAEGVLNEGGSLEGGNRETRDRILEALKRPNKEGRAVVHDYANSVPVDFDRAAPGALAESLGYDPIMVMRDRQNSPEERVQAMKALASLRDPTVLIDSRVSPFERFARPATFFTWLRETAKAPEPPAVRAAAEQILTDLLSHSRPELGGDLPYPELGAVKLEWDAKGAIERAEIMRQELREIIPLDASFSRTVEIMQASGQQTSRYFRDTESDPGWDAPSPGAWKQGDVCEIYLNTPDDEMLMISTHLHPEAPGFGLQIHTRLSDHIDAMRADAGPKPIPREALRKIDEAVRNLLADDERDCGVRDPSPYAFETRRIQVMAYLDRLAEDVRDLDIR